MEKKRLRILVLSQYFWPENFRINDLTKFLSKKKHDIDILTGIPNYPNGKIFENYKNNKKFFKTYNNCRVYRVHHWLRRDGTPLNLMLNFITFFISALFFSIKKLSKVKYDYIIIFGTSPITVALIGINLSFFTNSKVVLWVLDLWPDVLKDIGILKKNIYKNFLSSIVNFIYNKTDIILCQSETFFEKIQTSSKKILFYSWPEEFNSKIKYKSTISDNLNIVFTGNMGQAQNLTEVMIAAKKLKHLNIYWNFIGGGRYRERLLSYKNKHKLNKINFVEYQKLQNIKKYLESGDVFLLSLIKGDATSNTIPGKFQTYLLFKKPILCHADGITNDYVKKFKLGLCSKPSDLNSLINNVLKFYKAKRKKNLEKYVDLKNINILKKKFSKTNILKQFNFELINNNIIKEIRCIKKDSLNRTNKNLIFSALNLAFLGSLVEKKIKITKNFVCWPDGIMSKLYLKKNVKKFPGREVLNKLKLKKSEKLIQIVGNLTKKNIDYLKKRFPGKKLKHIALPYGNEEFLKKFITNKLTNGIIFLTLPTPKQEIIATYISANLTNYRIFCFGGAINMLSGEEPPVPRILENNLEFLWRLRFDTKRRLGRVLKNLLYFLYGIIFRKIEIKIKYI